MTNSPLISYTFLSPNHSGERTHEIDRITPHCVVGQCSLETLGYVFAQESRQASSNYGIGADGRIGMFVEERNRSWCSSSNANDQRAVTIECASDAVAPYAFKDVVYNRLIALCADICKRNGKQKLLWFGDKDVTLAYEPAPDEMVLTVHRWFANKSCPGEWLYDRMSDLANTVTSLLQPELYIPAETKDGAFRVQVGAYSSRSDAEIILGKLKDAGFNGTVVEAQDPSGTVHEPASYLARVTADVLNVRRSPSLTASKVTTIRKNEVYTIVEESNGWGKLKSGAGWVMLKFVEAL